MVIFTRAGAGAGTIASPDRVRLRLVTATVRLLPPDVQLCVTPPSRSGRVSRNAGNAPFGLLKTLSPRAGAAGSERS